MFAYCGNNPVTASDPSGNKLIVENERRINGGSEYTDTGTGDNHSVYYFTPLYRQNNYHLCWAFCQVMVESYKSGITYSNDEATNKAIEIAKSYHDSDDEGTWNQGGWPLDKGAAIHPDSINDIYEALLQNGGPVYAYYSPKSSEVSAHLILVVGVNCSTDTVYTNNPWGIRGAQSFSDFLVCLDGKFERFKLYSFECLYLTN